MSETLGDLGEFEVIRRLLAAGGAAGRPSAGATAGGLVLGAGDDAAVVRPREGHDLVVTTDTFLEGTHFHRAWIGGEVLGARFAAANLSDLAAMAAAPRWALVSFGARPDHAVADLTSIQRGIAEALAAHGASIVGGNLTAVSGDEWMSLTLLGEVPAGAAWTRAGALPGDSIAVTGFPGRSGAMVALARRDAGALDDPRWRELAAAWRSPCARVELAQALRAASRVRAAIDLSDGFSSDLAHLCGASGVGARLAGETWPSDPALEAAAGELGVPVEALRFGASDDYELLLAVPPEQREACARVATQLQQPLAFIGTISTEPGIVYTPAGGTPRPLAQEGYDHFRLGGA